jgi:hypothetical protein
MPEIDYREKAERCRRLARGIAGDPAANKLLQMAAEYEALAAQADAKSAPHTIQQQQQQQQPQPDPAEDKE